MQPSYTIPETYSFRLRQARPRSNKLDGVDHHHPPLHVGSPVGVTGNEFSIHGPPELLGQSFLPFLFSPLLLPSFPRALESPEALVRRLIGMRRTNYILLCSNSTSTSITARLAALSLQGTPGGLERLSQVSDIRGSSPSKVVLQRPVPIRGGSNETSKYLCTPSHISHMVDERDGRAGVARPR